MLAALRKAEPELLPRRPRGVLVATADHAALLLLLQGRRRVRAATSSRTAARTACCSSASNSWKPTASPASTRAPRRQTQGSSAALGWRSGRASGTWLGIAWHGD